MATDTSSRTSVALLQVLLTKFFGGPRELAAHPPQLEEMLKDHDAALLIGDAALVASIREGYHVYDLAHLWREATGKPFVFAFWAVRMDSLDRTPEGVNLAKVFQLIRGITGSSRRTSRSSRTSGPPKLGLSEGDIRSYLTDNIHYDLDRECHAGFRLFLQYAQEIGLLTAIPELRFLGPVAFGSARR